MVNIRGYKQLCKIIRRLQENDHDIIIPISGYAGVGKSTLALKMMKEIVGHLAYTRSYMEENLVYGRKEFDDKLELYPKYSVFCADEVINMLFKRDFQNRKQNEVIKKINTYRSKFFVIFLLLPNFGDLDKSIRDSDRIKFWIHCKKRGEAIIFQPEDNPFNPDKWNMLTNMKMLRSGFGYWQLPNYIGDIVWGKLPDSVFETYEEVKDKKRRESYEEEEEKKEDKDKELSKKRIIQEIYKKNPSADKDLVANWFDTNREYINECLRKAKL